MIEEYDVVVVGAGHAGCEAAAASARLGVKTLLITMDMFKFAQMSCNPAIGGIAKGQIVREIDALGGLTGIVTDMSSIQFRMLNRSKGPAMWSPRAQCDRVKFSVNWRNELEQIPNLYFWQDAVKSIDVEEGRVVGIETVFGVKFKCSKVVVTAGTFLNGLMHVGERHYEGGRIGEIPSHGLTETLLAAGIKTGRMKTGTPARIDGRTIDFSKMTAQSGDENPDSFSYLTDENSGKIKIDGREYSRLPQRDCYISYTNPDVHDELRKGFDRSPLFNGTIKSTGPRYCPSVETKIITFADKQSHPVFLEPEGTETCEYYLNGFSSSLPFEVQYAAIRKIPGLENCKIFRPGYAIEYDYFDPTQLLHTLESKVVKGCYFAGQVNGTTGYEEAACQGLMAGANAALSFLGKDEFVLSRKDAYIGVLIDDLVTKGVDEPYRMFTSRSEYRILLRQDNADERLTQRGFGIGLASEERFNAFKSKASNVNKILEYCKETSVSREKINPYIESKGGNPLAQGNRLSAIVLRTEVSLAELTDIFPYLKRFDRYEIESAEIKMKYQGYIEREEQTAEKLSRLDYVKIPTQFDYEKLQSLSIEARQKLARIRPANIGQASRIPGVSPSDINTLLIHLGR
ncbi:MAG: tRNA uridine-5-carboxymethylaminomethyl(34) synthesis enzyme MnmG [Bacteroidales bacterium]|nr:tRNA uridine-5-carboxymethylaminomethyl(34) synthesis enzyme MnmG [Bacteroidales bacterium]